MQPEITLKEKFLKFCDLYEIKYPDEFTEETKEHLIGVWKSNTDYCLLILKGSVTFKKNNSLKNHMRLWFSDITVKEQYTLDHPDPVINKLLAGRNVRIQKNWIAAEAIKTILVTNAATEQK